MTFVVTGNGIRCKYADCVEICPLHARPTPIYPEAELPREVALHAELSGQWPARATLKRKGRPNGRPFLSLFGFVPVWRPLPWRSAIRGRP